MVKAEAKRFNAIRCGRRWGKDILLQDILINAALNSNKPVAWFAPTYRMLLDNWRQVRHILAPVTTRPNDSEHRLELITGSVIDMWSLDNHDAARGRKYGLVVINEAAMIRSLQESWEMVIRPTLADYQGSAYFASTPKGFNFFHTLCGIAESDQDWSHFHYQTSDNPHIKQTEINEMQRLLPASVFRQEILAEFLTDGSYFQNVEATAVIEQPDAPAQHHKHTVVMGVDWGKQNDWTVISVACRSCNRVVDWQRFNQIDYHIQRGRLQDMVESWQPMMVLPERNSIGEPNIEELERSGIPILRGSDGKPGFNTTATSKADLIESLHMALVRDKFLVPKDYADELRAYEIEIRAGAPKFGAPSGLHDDRVMSLALCWRAMTSVGYGIIGWD